MNKPSAVFFIGFQTTFFIVWIENIINPDPASPIIY